MSAKGLLLLLFLGGNAIHDLRKKEILLLPTLGFLICSCIGFCIQGVSPGLLFYNAVPGILLLAVSLASGGKIGAGDAFIVMVTGLYMDLFSTFQLLWQCVWVISLYAGGRILYKKWRLAFGTAETGKGEAEENQWKQEVPMVPVLFFLVLIWIII